MHERGQPRRVVQVTHQPPDPAQVLHRQGLQAVRDRTVDVLQHLSALRVSTQPPRGAPMTAWPPPRDTLDQPTRQSVHPNVDDGSSGFTSLRPVTIRKICSSGSFGVPSEKRSPLVSCPVSMNCV